MAPVLVALCFVPGCARSVAVEEALEFVAGAVQLVGEARGGVVDDVGFVRWC